MYAGMAQRAQMRVVATSHEACRAVGISPGYSLPRPFPPFPHIPLFLSPSGPLKETPPVLFFPPCKAVEETAAEDSHQSRQSSGSRIISHTYIARNWQTRVAKAVDDVVLYEYGCPGREFIHRDSSAEGPSEGRACVPLLQLDYNHVY